MTVNLNMDWPILYPLEDTLGKLIQKMVILKDRPDMHFLTEIFMKESIVKTEEMEKEFLYQIKLELRESGKWAKRMEDFYSLMRMVLLLSKNIKMM